MLSIRTEIQPTRKRGRDVRVVLPCLKLAVQVALTLAGASMGFGAEKTSPPPAERVDLAGATIVVPREANGIVLRAAEMLRDEIASRTSLRLQVAESAAAAEPRVVIGTKAALKQTLVLPAGLTVPQREDGYLLRHHETSLYLVGHDPRGCLFAVGRLIRTATFSRGGFAIPSGLELAGAPRYRMRGHQLGHRNTANSYDAWDADTYEQYIRDCVIFGANAVELIPSLSPERFNGPVMRTTQRAMNLELARRIHSYGLDVWLFLSLGGDVRSPQEYQRELLARDALFSAYPAIDHVMVPGGDPGHTAPEDLMPWLKDLAAVLRRHFPEAGLWVSNQGFTFEQNDTFFRYLREEEPDWLTGVVFGPWTKLSLEEERERTPQRYAIRRYPDITHNVRCQYPVPGWDRVFAQTIGRECANPRPAGTARIHNLLAPLADGFVTYSDGCHDDLNKMIWSALGWDPQADVRAIVREYARVFFGEPYAENVAEGLWMLERNWRGAAAQNETIDATLRHWQSIEERGGKELAANWRFQLYLLRATCDAYLRARSIAETEQEEAILAALRATLNEPGSRQAPRRLLQRFGTLRVRPDLRLRIEELSIALLRSIGLQLSVLEPYRASNSERGAILDGIDRPLNNRLWLEAQLGAGNRDLARIVNWEAPRPGALYDDLGCAWKQPHLMQQPTADTDPGFVLSTQDEHSVGRDKHSRAASTTRLSWLDHAQTLFGTPLRMRYEGLDTKRAYTVRATYAGRYRATMRLVADGRYEVHGPLAPPDPVWPLDFPLPREATADGVVNLEWQLVAGRGCQVAEVWLLPDDETAPNERR